MTFKNQLSHFDISSNLNIIGSFLKAVFAGQVTINNGSFSPQANNKTLAKQSSINVSNRFSNRNNLNEFPERQWDRKDPIYLFMQNKEYPTSKEIISRIPKELSSISFDSFRLRLGPNLKIVTPLFILSPVDMATLNVDSLLTLNGPLNENLELRGVVRMTKGRVNLLATTLHLDKSYQNVSIFSPSMGFTPFLDFKMTTRVADAMQHSGDASSELKMKSYSPGSLGGSRFVKIYLTFSGPADRLVDNLRIRSFPSRSKNELLALMGANIGSMLQSNQVENIFDNLNLGDRFQFAVYPAFVGGPEVGDENNSSQSTDSDDLESQRAWVAELGVNVSERINFSIQAIPSREDVPPQGTITYQLNPSLNVLGSLDNNGNWQSELMIFLRY